MSTAISMYTLQQIRGTAGKLGAKLPKAFTAEADKLVALSESARAYGRNAKHISVADTILDVLAEGSDPYDDAVVHEAVMHARIAEYGERVTSALFRRFDFLLANSAEEILAAFKPCVAEAGATLSEVYERFGDVSIDDAQGILARGGDAAQAWADAQKAEQSLSAVLTVRAQLAQITGSGVRNGYQYKALTIADIPASDFIGNQLGNTMPRGWEIARNGWTFSLATSTELATRIDAVLAGIEQDRERDRNAPAKAWKRMHGAGAA